MTINLDLYKHGHLKSDRRSHMNRRSEEDVLSEEAHHTRTCKRSCGCEVSDESTNKVKVTRHQAIDSRYHAFVFRAACGKYKWHIATRSGQSVSQ